MADKKKAKAKALPDGATAKQKKNYEQAIKNGNIERANKVVANVLKGGGKDEDAKTPEQIEAEKEAKEAKEKQKTIEETNKLVTEATRYGDTLPDKYVPRGTFGTIDTSTTPEMRAYLDMLKQTSDTAGQYTDYETEALNELRSGMQGYSAPEVQAMREAAARELDRQYQTQMAMQSLANARGGVRGRASNASMQDLQQGRMEAGGN